MPAHLCLGFIEEFLMRLPGSRPASNLKPYPGMPAQSALADTLARETPSLAKVRMTKRQELRYCLNLGREATEFCVAPPPREDIHAVIRIIR